MIKEFKGLILCICSAVINLISGFLIIIGAYNQNKILIYIALVVLIIGMLLMIYGIFLIYQKYKVAKEIWNLKEFILSYLIIAT